MTEPTSTSCQPEAGSPTWRRWLRAIDLWVFRAVGILVLGGTLVRLTVKDSLPGTRVLFFATPIAVLLAGATWCALSSFWRRRIGPAFVWGLITVLFAGWWIQHDWRMSGSAPGHTSASSRQKLKVLFWNVARRQDLAPAAEYLRMVDADIIGLVEVSGDVEKRRRFWRETLPEYDVSVLGGQIYLLTKGKSGQTTAITLPGGQSSIARQLSVTIRGMRCEVFVVDFDARPGYSRIPGLKLLSDLTEGLKGQPVLIMGDFNTPPDSIGFLPLRKHLRQTFETVGHGYAPTWPFPVPVLQLDQMWVNEELKTGSCHHGNCWASDHRPVVAEFHD